MTGNPLSTLIDLVAFDQITVAMEREIEKIQQELIKDNQEVTLCNVALDRSKEHAHTSRKEVDAKEFEMKTLDQEEKNKRKRLDTAANKREYDALAKEIEMIKKKQHNLEQDLLTSWKKFENAEQDLQSKKEFCQEKVTSLNTVIVEKMQHVEVLKQKFQKHRALREEKMKGIPAELLEKYSTMYKQVSDPVVPIRDSSCSACFYQVTQQTFYDLKRGRLLQCKHCFRFLYYPPDEIAEIIEEE